MSFKDILQLFKAHRLKLAFGFISIFVFAFLLFPFDDLGDLVSSQVGKLTNNQVFVQFDTMNLTVLPEPGLSLSGLDLEMQNFPPLRADEVVFLPSISALIHQKPGGSFTAKGFLRGEVELSLSPGSKSENGVERQKLFIKAQSLSLQELKKLLRLPVEIGGRLEIESRALADLSFSEQPDVDVAVKIDNLMFPAQSINTPDLGALNLPEFKFSQVSLKGRLSAGKFLIEEGRLGGANDDLRGSIKGDLSLMVQNQGQRIVPIPGAYSLEMDLNMRKAFEDQLVIKFALGALNLEQYRTATDEGGHYRFKLVGNSFAVPPSTSALR